MVARWLRVDMNQYSNVTLPFVDAAQIPDWALPGVKTMYALGYLKGSSSNGQLLVRAESTITRAEAVTILGRIQGKGMCLQALTDFTDAADVPAWSLSYVESLVGQGIVSGYDGLLRPNDSVTRAR